MGLFSSDGKSRAQRKAEAKALKAKAKLEAKLDAKDRRRTEKARRKTEHKYFKKELKAQRKNSDHVAKNQAKVAKAEAKKVEAQAKAAADAKALSPASVRRYLTVARLVAPVVIPIVYRAAVAGRGRLTALQAGRVGVSPEVLRQFSGHGATLSARIATTRTALDKVTAQDKSADSDDFVKAMATRLDNLSVAVHASEAMPAGQRRTAHQSIDDELSAIDADILARLGVRA
ncbi:hypothetical protein Gbro_0148 [Gordonia bronchialis DSM 43247]|uniref:Uncharacterized protein n=1 Tax=Gordonia bronchialis (strain ATCC 25592 / DSM 43247 / BCRC 13721 / JCM 3198 / KCTC 3076 / NBRC 16047 / NCTC 10667) TaxID=526226 RepID=D0LB65_GORB4|nr:DUF6474 family protein [Gordonia bronchialis]ACY19496.1 hypothetical protein Gbro_0148 [Gordonia bronchialis DSM 43247]MCC3322276.1 DUF6474 family protein [Gordonia bronchialis]QGS26574.1 hypothetical protein FOB84_23095 [Gordonia bronchialis]UAK37051.1 DUF6474 family protein [Gordonia bronchialis]STQ62254.1 Uncharacterised protein [Gordonia bronchialis]